MSRLEDLRTYLRYVRGLPRYLKGSLSLEQMLDIIAQRRVERDESFLRLAGRGIYANNASPYLPLLKNAGCEFGDLRNLVHSQGLENALRELVDAGVRVSFDEFKGRTPMVRDGKEIPVDPNDFDNPHLAACYYGETGGSTGKSTRIPIDVEWLAHTAPYTLLSYHAHGIMDAPVAAWHGILPDHVGLSSVLHSVRCRQAPRKWFTPLTPEESRATFKHRAAMSYTLQMAKLMGVSMPTPELVSPEDAIVIARWMADMLEAHGICVLRASVSRCLRVSLAARKNGIDLSGAVFMVGGEPPTPAKVEGLEASGAHYFPSYFMSEAGQLGIGCANPSGINDLHFFDDKLALITRPCEIEGFGITVDAFCLTTTLPSAHKILLNVEFDDYGVVEQRHCGCPLDKLGFKTHVRDIHSYRKLTGEGVTLVGGEVIDVLQKVLPERFGGSPLDYQLMEEEDGDGLTRLSLIISPTVTLEDESEAVRVMLDALSQSSVMADLGRANWQKAGTLRVRRMEPVSTFRGKTMPLHLSKNR